MKYPDTPDRVLAVAVVVTDPEGYVYLRPRTRGDVPPGTWEIAATYWRPGERLMESAIRTLREDMGIEQYLSLTYTGRYYDDPDRHPGSACIPLLFHCVIETATVLHASVRRYGTNDLADLHIAFDNSQMIRDVLEMR